MERTAKAQSEHDLIRDGDISTLGRMLLGAGVLQDGNETIGRIAAEAHQRLNAIPASFPEQRDELQKIIDDSNRALIGEER